MSALTADDAYPRMETERLALRALRLEDAGFILQEWGSPMVTYYMRDEEPLRTLEAAEAWMRSLQTPEKTPDFRWWGIELLAEGRLIGTCGYCYWDTCHNHVAR